MCIQLSQWLLRAAHLKMLVVPPPLHLACFIKPDIAGVDFKFYHQPFSYCTLTPLDYTCLPRWLLTGNLCEASSVSSQHTDGKCWSLSRESRASCSLSSMLISYQFPINKLPEKKLYAIHYISSIYVWLSVGFFVLFFWCRGVV